MDERLNGLMKALSFDENYLFHAEDRNLGGKIAAALSAARAGQKTIRLHIRRQAAGYRAELDAMGAFLKQSLLDALRRGKGGTF